MKVANKQIISSRKSFIEKNKNLTSKTKLNQSKIIKQNQQRIQNKNDQSHLMKFPIQIKNYIAKFNSKNSFSQNRLKNRKNAMLSRIFSHNEQNQMNPLKNYLQNKSINIIKQNIKKLQINLPNGMPNLLYNFGRKKHIVPLSARSSRQQKQEKLQIQKYIIQSFEQQRLKLLSKRVSANHFDRSKYFKHPESELKKSYLIKRQKSQHMIKQKQKSLSQAKSNKNNSYINDVTVICRVRTPKPKTAGGFLKQYQVKQHYFRPDVKINIEQFDFQ